MSAFGKVLGATFAVVLVSKVGLTVAFHADARSAEQAQNMVDRINNTSELAEPFSRLVAVKKVDEAGIVLDYTLKPGFVDNIQQMGEAEVQNKALNADLKAIINDGINVVVKFRNEQGQIVKKTTFSQENIG